MFSMLTKLDEFKDRVEARKLAMKAMLVELRADTRHEAALAHDRMAASLAELETTIKDGWDNLTDTVKAKLDEWLERN
jgi:hypothetical protein